MNSKEKLEFQALTKRVADFEKEMMDEKYYVTESNTDWLEVFKYAFSTFYISFLICFPIVLTYLIMGAGWTLALMTAVIIGIVWLDFRSEFDLTYESKRYVAKEEVKKA